MACNVRQVALAVVGAVALVAFAVVGGSRLQSLPAFAPSSSATADVPILRTTPRAPSTPAARPEGVVAGESGDGNPDTASTEQASAASSKDPVHTSDSGGSNSSGDTAVMPSSTPIAQAPLPQATRQYFDAHLPSDALREGKNDLPRLPPGVHVEPQANFYHVDPKRCPAVAKAAKKGRRSFLKKCNPNPPCQARSPPQLAASVGGHATAGAGGGPLSQLWGFLRGYVPETLASGETVVDAVQRSLREAWGPKPPRVDLYLRAGCGAIDELHMLYPSIELFWPSFLGDVLIVLDQGDQDAMEAFRPANWQTTKQSYRFIFEDVPCLSGRIFNQVSYLELGMHSTADFVVTTDSDTVFHTPVTPDLLFDKQGRVMLAVATKFQYDHWKQSAEFFTAKGRYRHHAMISQPVTYAPSTLSEYLRWMDAGHGPHGKCYFDLVLERLIADPKGKAYCWMCQVGVYLTMQTDTVRRYNMVDVQGDASGQPEGLYQRYALHIGYEPHNWGSKAKFRGDKFTIPMRVQHAMMGGLCNAFGDAKLPECSSKDAQDDLAVVQDYAFRYTRNGVWGASADAKAAKLREWQTHFRAAEAATCGLS